MYIYIYKCVIVKMIQNAFHYHLFYDIKENQM